MLSDRVGRRPVVLLSNFGSAIDYAIMALAPDLGWLFIGRIISGATTASISVATAYITDITPPEKRAAAFGLIGSAFGLGFILGPAIGGMLGNFDPRLTFWVAMGFSLLNFLYGSFVLPESLAPDHRTPVLEWRRANPFGSLQLLRRHRELYGLTMVNFFGYVAHEAYPTVWVLYCMAIFGWSSEQIGLSLALVGVTSAISSALFVGRAVNKLGERKALLFGLGVAIVSFAMLGSSVSVLFLLGIVVGALAIYGPPSQALMTRRVGPAEQGELQGAIGCVRGVAMILGPGLFSAVFAQFSGPWRAWHVEGAPWFLAALLMLAALLVAWRVTSREGSSTTTGTEQPSAPVMLPPVEEPGG